MERRLPGLLDVAEERAGDDRAGAEAVGDPVDRPRQPLSPDGCRIEQVELSGSGGPQA